MFHKRLVGTAIVSFIALLFIVSSCNTKEERQVSRIKWSGTVVHFIADSMSIRPTARIFLREFAHAKSDTASINRLNEIVEKFYLFKMNDSIRSIICIEVYQRSQLINYAYGIIDANRNIGHCTFIGSRKLSLANADSFYRLSLTLAEKYRYEDLQVKALCQLARRTFDMNPEKANQYLLKALPIAKKIHRIDLRIEVLEILHEQSSVKFLNATRLDYQTQIYALAKEIADTELIFQSLMEFSNLAVAESDTINSLIYCSKALAIAIATDDTLKMSDCLQQLYIQNFERKDTTKALIFFRQLKSVLLVNPQLNSYLILASDYHRCGNADSAIFFYTKALELTTGIADIGTQMQEFVVWLNLADLYLQIGQINKSSIALENARTSPVFNADLFANPLFKITYYRYLTENLLAQSEFRMALLSTDSLIKYSSTSFELLPTVAKMYKQKSSLYDSLHQTLQAYHTLYHASLLLDSINQLTQEDSKKFLKLKAAYATEQYKAEQKYKALITDKNSKRQKYIINIVAVVLGIVLIFLGVVFHQMKQVRAEKTRGDDLLLNILPAEVAEELKVKGTADAKFYDDVTIFFSDFKNFTTVSERLTAQELVNELHFCFSAFDSIMNKYEIEKIKTIGDAYLAVSGLPEANPNHASTMVQAAIEVRDFMINRKKINENSFEVRIGVHSGHVVAGIVGIKKYAYDIWGDAVNTAARMEQSGEVAKVNISEATYQLVKNSFDTEYRGEIEAKNKGKLRMYFVDRF